MGELTLIMRYLLQFLSKWYLFIAFSRNLEENMSIFGKKCGGLVGKFWRYGRFLGNLYSPLCSVKNVEGEEDELADSN